MTVKPEKFGQQQNYNTLSDKFGSRSSTGRDRCQPQRPLQNGLVFQGGLSSGRTLEDNCEIVRSCPRC